MKQPLPAKVQRSFPATPAGTPVRLNFLPPGAALALPLEWPPPGRFGRWAPDRPAALHPVCPLFQVLLLRDGPGVRRGRRDPGPGNREGKQSPWNGWQSDPPTHPPHAHPASSAGLLLVSPPFSFLPFPSPSPGGSAHGLRVPARSWTGCRLPPPAGPAAHVPGA